MNDLPEFYVDRHSPGVVRGGWYDDLGGMLVGMQAEWVRDALNEKLQRDGPPINQGSK